MDSGPSREALEATFNELTHLLVTPARLTLEDAELGVGGFGEVCLATLDKSSQSPKKVAVKELRIVQASVARQRIAFRLARELKIWAKVKHPNILELIGYYLSENYVCGQLVSPFMVNGNVMQYIKRSRVSVAVRLKFVRDIVAGLRYLHDLSPPICHGDLKPANVLVNENLDAVLCDFGVSSFIHESEAASGLTTSKSTKGSTRYMSPELLLEEGSKHTLQSDVWAWGCTAFEVMTESIPYSTRTKDTAVVLEIYQKSPPGPIDALGDLILGPGIDPVCHTGLSSLKSIIPQCWDFDPAGRPSSSGIFHCIDIPGNVEPRLEIREEPVAGISSLSIQDDSSAPFSAGMCKVNETNRLKRIEDEDEDAEDADIRLCIFCKERSAFGSQLYCSRTCKREHGEQEGARPRRKEWLYTQAGPPVSDLCMNCQQYLKVPGRDFCSRTCFDASTLGNYQFPGVVMPGFAGSGQPQAPPPPPPGKPCQIPNCPRTEYAPGAKYCSNKCRKAAVEQGLEVACLMCKELPKAPKRYFCGKGCFNKAEQSAPILLDVPKTDPKFADIVKQFNDTWQGSSKPMVHRICKVVNAKAVENRFQAYRQKVEQAGNWVSRGKTAGNENRRWHGTVRECTVGDDPNKLEICASTTCRLCCAIRTNFEMKYVAVGVYGLGIYTSAYSSTSHGYTRVAMKGSPYRAMFLTSVVAGKEHIFTMGVTEANAKAPPAGYDSVAVGAKHSELIVFESEAIRPCWLVLYS